MIELTSAWALSPLYQPQLSQLPQLLQQVERQAQTAEQPPMPQAALASVAEAEQSGLPVTARGNVAVVKLQGVMLKSFPWLSNYVASSYHVRLAVETAAGDDGIDHILIVADTPGGSVAGMHELADAVSSAAQNKNVVVHSTGLLASAGFYVATGANRIITGHKRHQVGSIGVVAALVDTEKMAEQAGIKVIPLTTGEHKGTGMQGVAVTEAQVAEQQRIVDELYADFLAVIETGRGLSANAVKPLADGRVFFADEALSAGLIDAIQPLEQTLSELPERQQQGLSREEAAALFADID